MNLIEDTIIEIHNSLQDKFGVNDVVTRALTKDFIVAKFKELVKKREITNFTCICSELNNTIFHIDNGEIYAEVLYQPSKTISSYKVRLILQTANEISWAWRTFSPEESL